MNIKDLVKKTFYMCLGEIASVQDKAEEIANQLIERGELKEKDKPEFIKELVEEGEKLKSNLDEKIQSAVDAAIKKLNIPTKDDIDELNKKIDAILNELNKEQ
jgi:polyhydroxyalkanoate synthesis regulator phasin